MSVAWFFPSTGIIGMSKRFTAHGEMVARSIGCPSGPVGILVRSIVIFLVFKAASRPTHRSIRAGIVRHTG